MVDEGTVHTKVQREKNENPEVMKEARFVN